MNVDSNELKDLQSAYKLIVENNEEGHQDKFELAIEKLRDAVGNYRMPHKKTYTFNPTVDDAGEGPSEEDINEVCEDLDLGLTADEIHNHPMKNDIEDLIETLLYKKAEQQF